MGEQIEYWRATKEMNREQKELYRNGKMKEDIETVRKLSAQVDVRNHGEHFIVTSKKGIVIDYFPGTQRWIVRGIRKRGNEVNSFIEFLTKN